MNDMNTLLLFLQGEIFGVSKYVIPSLKILNDVQFQNLSVSSSSWIDIVEIPPQDLHLFLATYKSKGYKILGVEQAQESTRLNDYKFERKSLLVLGYVFIYILHAILFTCVIYDLIDVIILILSCIGMKNMEYHQIYLD